ncbi:MAG: class I SAM-dependent methyltransferase [Chitinophagales bacterium]
MSKLFQLSEYIYYTLSSITKYKIHSPFVYKMVTEVFEKEAEYKDYKHIENLRDALKNDTRIIEVNDLGAGTKAFNKTNKRKVSSIVRKSVKKEKYGHLLFMLIRHFKLNTILELGTSLGITTAYLASAHSNTKVYTIEGCRNIADVAQENFDKLGLKNIDLTVGNFDDELIKVCQKVGKFDLVFIDGNHREVPTIDYFNTVLPFCHNDTILVFDDIHWSEEMQEAWEFVKNHEQVKLTIDLFEMGMVFLRKEFRQKEHMQISY